MKIPTTLNHVTNQNGYAPPGRILRSLCCLLAMLALPVDTTAQSSTLHGNAGETQVVREMRMRLTAALAKGDVKACQREGDNLARYGKAKEGVALIAQDVASIQRQLDAIKIIYKRFYDLRTLNNKESVKQAFNLIDQLQDKLLDDARDDVLVLFIPAHAVSSKIAVEFVKSAKDIYGNNTDAGELRDTANALKELDLLVKKYDAKMKQLTPEIRGLEQTRTFLISCHTAFIAGAEGTTNTGTTSSKGKSPFDGQWQTHRKHTDGCGYAASEALTFSTDAQGITSPSSSSFLGVARGKINGTSLTVSYGIANNAASGQARFALDADGKSFSGTFSDKNGHSGTISGRR